VALRRGRAAAVVATVSPILEAAAAMLLDRLDDTTRRFGTALEIGGRGVVAPLLRARGIATISLDLAPAMAAINGGAAVAGDEEALPFGPDSFDLIVASLSLHQVNDLPGALVQLRRALRPDGLFLASLPGLGTLQALREALVSAEAMLRGGASPRVSPFPELRDMAALLQRAGFALPVADLQALPLEYRSAMGLVADLRAAGEQNAVLARDGATPPRAMFARAFAALGAPIPANIPLLMLTGWAPHASQSRPARPGSANARLADALGAEERSAGEAAPYAPGGASSKR